MKIEGNWFDPDSFSLGIFSAKGEDEEGEFSLLTFGFLIISIDIYIY